ncbi:MAG TPA: substrate-binding domain-containing protein [Gemmatimonadales bacterium]|jgi:mxaJ protein
MSSRYEAEPSATWNGWGVVVCVASFGLGIVAASDNGPTVMQPSELRVCADPNNLPFSNRAGQGFENQIAELIARDLGVTLSYTWMPERTGFLRNTLDAGRCDVVTGVPSGDSRLLTTSPYYRSTYVFVQRADRGPPIRSFSDPRLTHFRIGIHVIGDDYNSLPPGVALAKRGLERQVSGFSLYGDYSSPSPPHELIQAVADSQIDLAIVWGPLAGYFGRLSGKPLAITPVPASEGGGAARFTYDIAMGVRRGDSALRHTLDVALAQRRTEIAAILARYGVPVVVADQELATRR